MTIAEKMARNWSLLDSFVGPDRKLTRSMMDQYKAEKKRRGWDDETGEGAE